jgi:hypothetical protein
MIAAIEKGFTFEFADQAKAEMTIRDRSQKGLYRLVCQTYLVHEDEGFAFSGDFECRLTSLYSTEAVPSLLTSDSEMPADWWSRGRFIAEELQAPCSDYPEYGKVRHFRLRKMMVTVEISNLVFAAGPPFERKSGTAFRSFSLRLSATPDPSASGSLAACPSVAPCTASSPGCFSKN